MTFLLQRAGVEAFVNAALPWRIGNAVVAYVAYLIQFFCPINLAIMYPHPGEGLPLWKIAAAAIALIAISAGVVKRRRSPYLVTGWLWYLGMLVPMIGLGQVGWQSRADRYTYLPQIGVCIMVAWEFSLSRRFPRCSTLGDRRGVGGAGNSDGTRLPANGILAQRRDVVETCGCLHRRQLCRPYPHRLGR